MRWLFHIFIVVVISMFAVSGCNDVRDVRCQNGECLCLHGDNCDMECISPPCTAICDDNGTFCNAECANGDCVCGPGAECQFFCPSGPCHVYCNGNSRCAGQCWNGSCNCSSGSNCVFKCASGPCHVNCEGNNKECDGECANGTCTCGPGSDCRFKCLDFDCKAICETGATCALSCPAGTTGVKDRCWISSCAAGDIQVCADGLYTVCGMPCPEAK